MSCVCVNEREIQVGVRRHFHLFAVTQPENRKVYQVKKTECCRITSISSLLNTNEVTTNSGVFGKHMHLDCVSYLKSGK